MRDRDPATIEVGRREEGRPGLAALPAGLTVKRWLRGAASTDRGESEPAPTPG